MTTWTDAQLGHQARVEAFVSRRPVGVGRVQLRRVLVALGLARGHFGPGGSFCWAHFASEHAAEVGQLAACGVLVGQDDDDAGGS